MKAMKGWMQAEERKAEQEDWRDGAKEGGEKMEGWRRGEGSLCGFESTVQQLPDKLVFPGTTGPLSTKENNAMY